MARQIDLFTQLYEDGYAIRGRMLFVPIMLYQKDALHKDPVRAMQDRDDKPGAVGNDEVR